MPLSRVTFIFARAIYVLCRLNEALAAALFNRGSFAEKRTFGALLGQNGQLLQLMRVRMADLLEPDPPICASPMLDALLAELLRLPPERAAASFLAGLAAGFAEMRGALSLPLDTLTSHCLHALMLAAATEAEAADVSAVFSGEDELELPFAETEAPIFATDPHKPEGTQLVVAPSAFLSQRAVDLQRNGWENLGGFFHAITTDIEYTAMQACGFLLVAHRDLPLRFKEDMCRQIADETRHAIVMEQLAARFGAPLGTFPCNHIIWERIRMFDTLAERLCAQQVVSEGNALLNTTFLQGFLQQNGLEDVADTLDFVNADEAVHVRIGNRWLAHEMDGDGEAARKLVERTAERIGRPFKEPNALPPALYDAAGFARWHVRDI